MAKIIEPITCSTVLADGDGLHELDRNKRIVSIPWNEVRRITLIKAAATERPFLQAVISVGLILFGYFAGAYPLYLQISKFFYEPIGRDFWDHPPSVKRYYLLGSLMVFIPLGAYLLFSAMKRRYCLHVETSKNSRKIFFQGETSFQEVYYFATVLTDRFGKAIDISTKLKNLTT